VPSGDRQLPAPGEVPPPPADEPPSGVSGVVYLDQDSDGRRDTGESGVPGATVNVLDSTGDTVGTATTAEDGTYSVHGLRAGTYRVRLARPSGLGSSTPDQKTVTLTQDDGAAVDFGTLLGSISGGSFTDTDGDGAQDAGEPGLPGVTAVLFPADRDTPLASTTTGSDGAYTFVNVPVGRYRVAVQPGAGRVPTAGPRGSVNPDTWLTPSIEITVSGDDITQAEIPMTGIAHAEVPGPARPRPGRPTPEPSPQPGSGQPPTTSEPGRPTTGQPTPVPNKPAPGSPHTRTPGPGKTVPAPPAGDHQPITPPVSSTPPPRPGSGGPAAPTDHDRPGKGGSLAFTGSPVDQLLWLAAALLTVGTGLLVAGRRRRRKYDAR
jgi:hypothetical protein